MNRLITFFARKSNFLNDSEIKSATGHIWFRLDNYGTYGFQTNGVVREKALPNDGSVTFKVSEKEYKKAVRTFERLRNDNYFINGDTCIGLACKVAISAGLSLTWGKTAFHLAGLIAGLPIDYLVTLRNANPDKIFP